jgi:ABC-type glycerol-3-phosphate transport system substrate-binding protein
LIQFGLDNLKYGRPEGGIAAWLSLREEILNTVQSVTTGRQDAQQALDALAGVADAAIADFGVN